MKWEAIAQTVFDGETWKYTVRSRQKKNCIMIKLVKGKKNTEENEGKRTRWSTENNDIKDKERSGAEKMQKPIHTHKTNSIILISCFMRLVKANHVPPYS